jgi:hypothetical protein
LDANQRTELIAALSDHELPRRFRRGSVRRSEPIIEVSADCHGRQDGPVRNAVLREIN